ncbi:MAG: 2-hydroxyacyl-CoA dehydratase [Candidatus Lokiarchaeota archaeon]|nr:2-hydroxyacyl-CoA dehydratase [Candidatus Lokiarchaeota archaeon]
MTVFSFPQVRPGRFSLFNSVETIKLAHAFFSGKEFIGMYKQKDPGKKVVSVTFPFSEIIFAMGAIPVNLVRCEDYTYKETHLLMRRITEITKIFGWGAIDNLLKLAYFTRAGADVVDILCDNMIGALNERYTQLPRYAEERGFPVDSCFASRMLYAANLRQGRVADASFDIPYRCPFFAKYYDSLTPFMRNNFLLDIPMTSGADAEAAMEADLQELVAMLERLTGNSYSDARLAEAIEATNEVKAIYKEILYGICKGDVLPYNPFTFAEVQALMLFSLTDCNSNLKAYRANFKRLFAEMTGKIARGEGFDASRCSKILYTPMFGGFEQENVKAVSKLGGRVILADWEIFGILEPISTTGDVLHNFALHMLRMNQFLGFDNETYANTMIRVAKDLGVDGVLFQGVFGCKNLGPVLKIFKEKARQNGIPVVETSFNNIGENVEQNKTRIEAFMEMIQA